MSENVLLRMCGISKQFAQNKVLENVSLQVHEG